MQQTALAIHNLQRDQAANILQRSFYRKKATGIIKKYQSKVKPTYQKRELNEKTYQDKALQHQDQCIAAIKERKILTDAKQNQNFQDTIKDLEKK